MADQTLEHVLRGPAGERVLVRRSSRRTRTVSITRRDGDLVVSVPARMTRRETDRWVQRMIEDLARKEAATTGQAVGDADLLARAQHLAERYLEGRARPRRVVWSTRQGQRWGSCTAADASLRISSRLRDMPGWVLDSVLVHELAHLLEHGHGPAFRELVERYPHTVRAEGFLDGVTYAQARAAGPAAAE